MAIQDAQVECFLVPLAHGLQVVDDFNKAHHAQSAFTRRLVGEFLHPEIFMGIFHDLDPASFRVGHDKAVISRERLEFLHHGGAIGLQLLEGFAGVAHDPANVVVAVAVFGVPVLLVLELVGRRFELDLERAATAAKESIVGMPFVSDMECVAGKVAGNAVVPFEIRPHVIARVLVINAQMMDGVVEVFCGGHDSPKWFCC